MATFEKGILLNGSGKFLEPDAILQQPSLPSVSWVHFTISNEPMANWLKKLTEKESWIANALLAEKVRPRLALPKEGAMLIIRVADTLDVNEHEELRSLRIYATEKGVITTSLRPLPIIQEIVEWIQATPEKIPPFELLTEMIVKGVRGLEDILEDLDENTDYAEQQVLEMGTDPTKQEVGSLALDALQLRRYLAPQKEVFLQLKNLEAFWVSQEKRRKIKESYERVSRQLDEVEVIRERIRIIREELGIHVGEEVNYRLYIFSVIAVFFLPLSFLTGLFGINVGGIPWGENPYGFLVFCLSLSGFTLIMTLIFKRLKWI